MSRRTSRLAVAGTLTLGLLAVGALAPSMRGAEPVCQFDGVERIVAVGDVHGAYDRFVELLRAASIIDERLRWAGGRAHFVQTGDVVDRGPDSRKVLDLLERLPDQARRAGGAVHFLLGNHEVMRMLGDFRYASPGESAAFMSRRSEVVREEFLATTEPPALRAQLQKEMPLGQVEMRIAFGQLGDYGEWLRKLNIVVKINGVLFLHGGISPARAGMSCEALNAAVRRELGTDLNKTRAAPFTSVSASEDGPLWYRGLALEPDAFEPRVDEILAKQNARAIVIGHTVAEGGRIRARFGGKVIQIDTGMQPAYIATGRASALEIQNGVFTALYTDGQEPVVGVPAETAKPAAVLQ